MEEPKSKSGGCIKAGGVGCAVLSLLGVLLIVLVMLNLESIKEADWYRSIGETANAAKQEFQWMLELRAELAAKYPALEVQVSAESFTGSQGPTRSLVVTFLNPDFKISEADSKLFAKGIATEVASSYPEIERYDQVTITFVAKSGVGVTFEKTQSFVFSVRDLAPVAVDGLETRDAS